MGSIPFLCMHGFMYFLTCAGQPVGWCIADKEDQDVVKNFLDKTKQIQMYVSVIMTEGIIFHTDIALGLIWHHYYKPLFNKRFQITIATKCLLWGIQVVVPKNFIPTFYISYMKVILVCRK